jgi:hypothetical protein
MASSLIFGHRSPRTVVEMVLQAVVYCPLSHSHTAGTLEAEADGITPSQGMARHRRRKAHGRVWL